MSQGTATTSPQALDANQEAIALRKAIIEALKQVYDPEIPVDICELGLIYAVDIYPIGNVDIVMTLTSPNCPVAESLPEQVRQAALDVSGVAEVQITLTFEPPYEQTMMSEVAALTLGFS